MGRRFDEKNALIFGIGTKVTYGFWVGLCCPNHFPILSWQQNSIPCCSLSGGDANNMDKWSFQTHASLPADIVRPCEGKPFLLSYKSFSFLEHYMIPSPKGDFPANNDPCRPLPECFIVKPSWPDTPGPSLFFPTYLEDNHKATISFTTSPLHQIALKPQPQEPTAGLILR